MNPRHQNQAQSDLFLPRLDDLCNRNHELFRLAQLIDWERIEKHFTPYFIDHNGAPGLPVRLMAGLMYLQHAFDVSDEGVIEGWLESPYWQYFCGETHFQHHPPCHPTSLTKWRQRIGEEGCEWLLTETIEAGLKSKALKRSSLKRVVVDTTVQEKNITFPTDSQLYNRARKALVELAHEQRVSLRQTYAKACRNLLPKIGRYGHAKQYKRMRKAIKKVKNYLGRVYRDLLRQWPDDVSFTEEHLIILDKAWQLLNQKKQSKNKLYSWHAPETECISKGKAHKRYEFGVKASFATTLKECFVVGARSFAGNPYDGHTLTAQLEQVTTLTDTTPEEAYVDRGYRGHKHTTDTQIIIAGQKRNITRKQKKRLRRRNTIEAIIGHMKQDGKLKRCYLKGREGDAINVIILSGVGQNIRKLLRWLFLLWILLRIPIGLDQKIAQTVRTKAGGYFCLQVT